MIDWRNHDSIWFAEPSNHRLFPGGSDYARYRFATRYIRRWDRVLDVGCNCGQVVVNLAQDLECDCVGIDIVADFIQNCRETKGDWGQFLCADFAEMRAEELEALGVFDVVTALEVIEHPIDLRKFRENVQRVLKPGGYLVVTTPHPDSPTYGYTYYRQFAHHVRMWTRWRLEQVFGPMVGYEEMDRLGKLATMGAAFQKSNEGDEN